MYVSHLVDVPGRLYEFEPGRRELKSPRREIGRDIVESAFGSISAVELTFHRKFAVPKI